MMSYEKHRRYVAYGLIILLLITVVSIFIGSYALHEAIKAQEPWSYEPIIIEKYYLVTPETFTILDYIVGGDSVDIFHHDGYNAPRMIKAKWISDD